MIGNHNSQRNQDNDRRLVAPLISIVLAIAGGTLAGCGGGGSSPTPLQTPHSSPTANPTPTPVTSSTPGTFGAAFLAQWPADALIIGNATETDTLPATDSKGNYAGHTQVTTMSRQQTGFAIQDQWLKNVDQVSLPGFGAVNRTTYRDSSSGSVTAYLYWTSDAQGFHQLGLDSYTTGNNNPVANLNYTIRYSSPGLTVPSSLTVGQTQRFALQRTVTFFKPDGSIDTAGSYVQPYAESVNLVDFEPVTVAAGTFQNAAKLQISQQGVFTDSDGITETLTYADTYWALPILGTVKGEESINVSATKANGSNADPATFPYSYDTVYALQYSDINNVVNGTPPGGKAVESRAAMAVVPNRYVAR